MPANRPLLACLTAAALLAGGAAVLNLPAPAAQAQLQQSDDTTSLIGEEAPMFKLPLAGGGKADLSEHLGKDIVVLDFWATWCGPCVYALPQVTEAMDELADQNVVFYAINLREGENKIRRFKKDKDLEFDSPMDARGEVGEAYKVEGIPTTVVIGTDGKIAKVHVGAGPNVGEVLKADVEELLAKAEASDDSDG